MTDTITLEKEILELKDKLQVEYLKVEKLKTISRDLIGQLSGMALFKVKVKETHDVVMDMLHNYAELDKLIKSEE